jgi:dipeptidyl-peptidase-4
MASSGRFLVPRAAAVIGAILAIGTLSPRTARAGEPSPALSRELGEIFAERGYATRTFGPARWLDSGRSYTTVEPSAPGQSGDAKDIVAYDTASGRREVLVPSSKLVPPGATKPLTIDDYSWSPGRDRLLVFTNAKKVWRLNTRGDYWVLDLGTGRLLKVGQDAPESSLKFAKFSPDGTRVAWVRDNDLWVEDLATSSVKRLTASGSETVINGTTDWVSEEEFRLRDGFRWSPDGRSIAFWSFDTAGVELYTLINDTDATYPTVRRYPYPKAGTKNSAVSIGVVSAAGGAVKWMDLGGDPRNFYVPRMEWAGSSDALALYRLNRRQNLDELLLADAKSGAVRSIFRDESKTWVDYQDVRGLGGGTAFVVLSERDGWRHAYRVPRDGGSPTLVTRFEGDVQSVEGVDEAGGWLYFLASPDTGVEQHLYRSRLDGSQPPERLTPRNTHGVDAYDLSPDRKWAFHTFSRMDEPPATDLVRLPGHETERRLMDNAALRAKAPRLFESPAEFFQVPVGGGVVLDGWALKPAGFDPARKYPVIVYVYGEPGSQTVVDRWNGARGLFHRALANEGYLIVSFDTRGTPSPKGAPWRKVVYGHIGVESSKEQAAAIRAFAAARPYVDANRIGIWGWSGGGSSTLNAMFRYPDVYKVGVAVASVPDERLYDTIYQERYMGLPEENADGYREGSPISFADGLKGKLLIVHGSGDDNVHYQGAERLVNRLVELGKPFDFMAYPNRTHSISEGKGTALHGHSLIARYLLENL